MTHRIPDICMWSNGLHHPPPNLSEPITVEEDRPSRATF